MHESFQPGRPAQVRLNLGEQQVTFNCEAGRYHAQIGDKWANARLRIKRRRLNVSEAGTTPDGAPEESLTDTTDLDTVLRCLTLGADHVPIPRGIRLSATDNWGHFRQNTFLTVSITLEEDGTIAVDEEIGVQDDSYY